MMKRGLVWLLVGIMSFSIPGCSEVDTVAEGRTDELLVEAVEEQEPFRIGILVTSTISAGWSKAGYDGVLRIAEKYNVDYSLIESPDRSDVPEHLHNMGVEGFDVVIPHSFAYADATIAIAPDFPETQFFLGGAQIAEDPNLASYDVDSLDMGFLAGVVAGLATKTNKIGHIGGMEFPQLIDGLNAFEAGAKYVNPDVIVVAAWVGNWIDATAGKELAVAMAEDGIDVIYENCGTAGIGVIEGAQAKGIYAIGINTDKNEIAPDTVLTSIIADYPLAILTMFELWMEDEIENRFYYFGAREGAVYYAPFYNSEEKLGTEKMNIILGIQDEVLTGELVVRDYVESVFLK